MWNYLIRNLISYNLEQKIGNKVTLNFLSNLIRNSNDETNFPRKLILTDTQVSKLLQMVHQIIYNFQKLSCLSCLRYSQE